MICHEDGIDEDSIHLETVFSISTSPESITNGRIQLKHTYPKAANLKKKSRTIQNYYSTTRSNILKILTISLKYPGILQSLLQIFWAHIK